jgi:hypothetical protein
MCGVGKGSVFSGARRGRREILHRLLTPQPEILIQLRVKSRRGPPWAYRGFPAFPKVPKTLTTQENVGYVPCGWLLSVTMPSCPHATAADGPRSRG